MHSLYITFVHILKLQCQPLCCTLNPHIAGICAPSCVRAFYGNLNFKFLHLGQ
jgi:hypothetical protein